MRISLYCVFFFFSVAGISELQAKQSKWLHDDLSRAFKASAGKKPIVILTHADWCTPCKQLSYEVIETPAGRKLLGKAVGVRVDFETREGRKVTKRYRILGLPTTLVLSAKGQEIGRIVGYPGRRAFGEALKDLLAGRSDIAKLRKQMAKKPKDQRLKVQYAQALLVRGKIKQAKAMLSKVMGQKTRLGAMASRIWGRYLLRVKRDGPAGTRHFLAAMKRFAGQPVSKGFMFWAAKGYHIQGKRAQALALFDGWIKKAPGKLRPLLFKADFMLHYKYDPKVSEKLVREALKMKPKMAWLHYMLAQARHQQRDLKGARKAIAQAIKLRPKLAIFRYYAKRLKPS